MADEEWFANRAQGWRAVGGRLTITRTHLTFRPNAFERRTGGKAWEAPLSEIVEVGVQDRTFGLLDGGLRKRLRVVLRGGVVERFVVNHLGYQVERLREAAGLTGPCSD